MNKDELLKLAATMDLWVYNIGTKYFCVKGINGHASTVYYHGLDDHDPIVTIKDHLLQMSRDSLKMELETLLSISKHH